MDIKAMQQAIIPIAKRHELELVVLFGSAARGKTDKFSDIDIAIRPKQNISYNTLARIQYEICKVLKRGDVEVIRLQDAGSLLLYFIANDGKLIYEERAGIFAQLQMNAFKLYVESKPFLQMQHAQLRERLASVRI